MDANELKRERKRLLEKARAICDAGDTARTGEVDDLIQEADRLERQIRAGGIERRQSTFASRGGPLTGRPQADRSGFDMESENGFSLVKTIRALLSADWQDAGREREQCQEAARQLGRQSRAGGVLLPEGIWSPSRAEKRDLLKGTGQYGGYTVADDVLGASFIDRLAPRSVCLSAGVQTMDGLTGDTAIPRLATGSTAYWVAENVNLTESTPTFEQVALSPKTVGAYVDISRRLLLQSSLDVEALVRNDILRSLGTAIDLAVLQGTGTDQPTGVKGTTGVSDISAGTGTTMAWADVVGLESAIATANADSGRLAYITNPHMRGVLKALPLVATYGDKMCWGDGPTPLNGYPAFVTGQIAATLGKGGGTGLSLVFFGDWSTVVLGRWSGLDVLVDPYTGSAAGTVRVVAFMDMDVAVRQPAAVVFGYYK